MSGVAKIIALVIALGSCGVAVGYFNKGMWFAAFALGLFGLIMLYVTTKV